jgi:hypothetical protein
MPSVRQVLQHVKVAPGAQDVIMQSFRSATQTQYDSYLKKWEIFAQERRFNPHAPTAETLVDFFLSCIVMD